MKDKYRCGNEDLLLGIFALEFICGTEDKFLNFVGWTLLVLLMIGWIVWFVFWRKEE